MPNPVEVLPTLNRVTIPFQPVLTEQDFQANSPLPNPSMTCLQDATQAALDHLKVPFADLVFIEGEAIYFQAMISQQGWQDAHPFMPLQRLSLSEAFSIYPWLNHQTFVIYDTMKSSEFSSHWLVERYGIRAYVGVPLLTTHGQCLGVLEVMEDQPRQFSQTEITLLEMIARCCTRELELSPISAHGIIPTELLARHPGLKNLWQTRQSLFTSPFGDFTSGINLAKFQLLTQLTQSLRTSLTPVLGMTSVLRQQIHGNLTFKQREYLDIVYQSGQELLALVNEISEISQIDQVSRCALPTPVDLELLCQQTIATLEPKALQRDQKLRLTVEENARIWVFDRDRIRQAIYHLIVGATEGAMPGSTLLIHLARRDGCLRFVIWASHPWLGDGLGQSDFVNLEALLASHILRSLSPEVMSVAAESEAMSDELTGFPAAETTLSQHVLRIILSQRLAETLGGQVALQGTVESGYRLVLTLPPASAVGDRKISEE